uniref:Integrase, catalytic region, zinc finger, CCHC-type, peptidase aspartic, catalytic n=1 Tax=Tanacetum cinerariifolium TaxID=118510 RepID=A0A6L2LRE7_TANCI|nr:hypothetical protein [Tanacetum cinerariifolium]
MTTLAEHIIVAGAENHSPMLEKSLYDSWTRPMKYSELTEAQQLQDDCYVQATNIILHGLPPDVYVLVNYQEAAKDIWDRGEKLYEYYWRFSQLINDMHTIVMTMQQVQVNTKFLNALPSEWSKFIIDIKLSKSLYTTNYDQFYAFLGQHVRHANEVRIMHERYPDTLALVANSPTLYNPSYLAVPMFEQGEYPIECINKAMAFLSFVASRFPPSNNQLRTSFNPRNQATIQDGRVIIQQVQERQTQSYAGTGNRGIATTSKGNYAAGQPREKLMLAEAQQASQVLDEEQLAFLADPGISEALVAQQTIPHNLAFQTEDLDAYDSNCDDISSAKAVLMKNISSCDRDVLSKSRLHIDSESLNKVSVVVVLDLSKVANLLYSLRDKDLLKSKDPQVFHLHIGNFMPPKPDLSFTGLDEFDDDEENVTQPKIVKKIVRPNIVNKEFVKPRQQEKIATKTVKKVEHNRKNIHRPKDEEGVDCLQNSTIFESLELMGKPKRKNTKVPQSSGSTENVIDEAVHKEWGDRLVRAAITVFSLEAERDSAKVDSSKDEQSLGEDASKQRWKINDIDADEDITLVNDQDNAKMFDVNDLHGEEVFVEKEVADKEVSVAGEVNAACIATTDKGKAIMIEEHVKPKKKKQIRLDEEVALKLQAEVNTFVDFRIEVDEGSSKRAGEITQERSKKQKVDDDKETAKLKKLMEIIPNEEEAVIDAIPLAIKSPKIVDWKIHKEE